LKRRKIQPVPVRANGLFAKADFTIDLAAGTVTCPNHVTVTIRRGTSHDFGGF
jgi:hypothetical protein